MSAGGSLSRSQSQMPPTSAVQPPHPVVANVAVASSSTPVAPASQAATMAPFVTPLHRHTVVLDGIVGIRVNHLLDVHIDNFQVGKPQ